MMGEQNRPESDWDHVCLRASRCLSHKQTIRAEKSKWIARNHKLTVYKGNGPIEVGEEDDLGARRQRLGTRHVWVRKIND